MTLVVGLTCVKVWGMKFSYTKFWIFNLVLNLTFFPLFNTVM